MALLTIPEKKTLAVDVTFRDSAGALSAPTSIQYRVDDAASGAEIRDWTSVGAASEITITLNATDNAMQDATREEEVHVLTVEATYGASDLLTDEYRYKVRNLQFYPAA